MTTATMSREQEAKLMRTLDAASDHIAAGLDQNDALAKAASANDVPRGHVPLLVYAYNTARAQSQLKSSDDPLEKAADFPMADTDVILGMMYPDLQQEAKLAAVAGVSAEYAYAPSWYKPETPALEKVASIAESPQYIWSPLYCETPEQQVRKRGLDKAAMEQALGLLRTEKTASELKVAQSLDDLIYYFQKLGSRSFGRVREDVATMFDQDAVRVLDYIADVHPNLRKQAMTPEMPVSATIEPYRTLLHTVGLIRNAGADVAAFNQKQAEYDAAYNPQPQGTPVPASDSLLDQSEKVAAPSAVGAMLGLTVAREAAHNIAQQFRGPDREKMIMNTLQSISTPEHELALRDLGVQSALQEMMTSDPIISGHDPQQVVNTFNELSQLAPRVMSQPAAIRSILRRQLETEHMEPFEVDQLAGLDTKLRPPTQNNPRKPAPGE